MSVTKKEYDQEYVRALDYLVQHGHRVGSPYVSRDGVRVVRVDDFPWTDDAVFEEAWGKEQATAIAAERPAPRQYFGKGVSIWQRMRKHRSE